MSRLRLRAIGCLLFGACAFAVPLSAASQESQLPVGGVSCYRPPAKLSEEAVAQFLANPTSLLTGHPSGGMIFLNFVRTLAGSDVRTVGPLIEIARNAAPAIKSDIATALANTAANCRWTRPDIALLIHESILSSDDDRLITVFLGVAGAIQTAAEREVPTRDTADGGTALGGTAFASGSEIEPTATRQGGGLPGFVGIDRRRFTSSKSSHSGSSVGKTNAGRTTGLDIANRFDGIVRSNDTIGSTSSASISRLFAPEGPVSQTAQ